MNAVFSKKLRQVVVFFIRPNNGEVRTDNKVYYACGRCRFYKPPKIRIHLRGATR